jgi:hypothetical protein
MTDGRHVTSRYLRAAVEEAVRDGAALTEIERDIVDDAAVTPDARAALWLYAWGAVERRRSGRPIAVVNAEPGFDGSLT